MLLYILDKLSCFFGNSGGGFVIPESDRGFLELYLLGFSLDSALK